MQFVLPIIQVIIAIALIGLILIQNGKGGLGSAFGGTGEFRSRRGAEQIIFRATIVFGIIFLLMTVINLLVK
jgi:protein translocase SecG subunit